MIGIEYAAYGLCAVLAVLLVYHYDLYDREPWYLLLAAILVGAAVMRLLGGLEDAMIATLAGAAPSPLTPALVAASLEEGARLLIVALVAVLVPRVFNDPMDGLIYGSIAGIGMALEESWAVVSQQPDGSLSAVELVRLSGHLTMGGITGFGVGLIKRRGARPWQWVLPLTACVVGAILLHFLWDVSAISQDLSGGLALWPALAASAVMLTGMGVYGALVATGVKWSRRVFAPRSRRSIWGWPFNHLRRSHSHRDSGRS